MSRQNSGVVVAPSGAHSREVLAEGPICTVAVCACGCLHITLGAITLRMEPAAAASLCATLRQSIDTLEQRRTWAIGGQTPERIVS